MAWAPDYTTLAEQKEYMRIAGLDLEDDAELPTDITSASRVVDDHCNRQFGLLAAPAQMTYVAWFDYERCLWCVDIDDLMITTGLVVETTAGGVTTDYTKEPLNAAVKSRPWTSLVFGRSAAVVPTSSDEYKVLVTAQFGWSPSWPVSVEQATRLQASRFAIRRDSPYGVAGSPDAGGSELRLLARADPDVMVALRGLRRARRVG